MDERFVRQFEDSVDSHTKRRAELDAEAAERLVTVYKRAYQDKYGSCPMIGSAERIILTSFLKACKEDGRGEAFAIEMLETYLTCNDEWLVKHNHDLKTFKSNLSIVTAAIGAKRKAAQGNAEARKLVGAVDHVELILYYLFESSMWLKGRNLSRAGKDTLLTAAGHVIRKDELRDYLRINWHWGGSDELGELCDLLDKYLAALATVPPVA